ncbi:hypothetical protein AQS8620_01376 [Aquimixticola soesokkakensis]|uniref:Uncharacterized protein n=2 Tax=Aquimixticola soesokkakensis TaxID=1519096 RepID=A0A1Y5SCB1_9RHOB|nr:hypothetical protein AQS8620_01376 [Aquimixticola soesokkakensis]
MPTGDLMQRIIAEADAQGAQRLVPAAPAVKRGLFATALAALGGWVSVAGLATATVAGIGIGVTSPATVGTLGLSALGLSAYSASASTQATSAASDTTYGETDYATGFYDLAVEG